MRWLILMMSLVSLTIQAEQIFTGIDYSGVYDCKGQDGHAGDYTGVVAMQLKPAHSRGPYASYDFKLEVPGYGEYPGYAAGFGQHLSVYFALKDPATGDFGAGLVEFSSDAEGKTRFHKFYFQPEYEGGNTGLEDCVRR